MTETVRDRKIVPTVWAKERAVRIPIVRLSPQRAAFTRWLKPPVSPWARKRFIRLNPPVPI